MDRVSIASQQDLGQRLAAIQAQKQSLAPAMLQQDKQALKRWEALDAEAASLRRQAELEELAAAEAKKQQAQAEQEAIRQARADREQQALQEAQIILSTSADIDAALLRLRDIFARRHRALRALANTKVCSSYAVNRMFAKFNATSAAHAHGLRDYFSLEPMLPAHVKKLSDADAWLSKPLTVADEPGPDDEPPKINGADNA